ncbi:MAG: nucleotidyltransferase domain-containing protein [Proteobacteria bacterium]|nr:nucleotidyltransferase domain-containing protein [Pseudomonadota bacterium]
MSYELSAICHQLLPLAHEPIPMSQPTIEIIVKKIRNILDGYPHIIFAAVFGSAAHNRLTPLSDVDIAAAGNRLLTYEEKIDLSLSLSRSLRHEVDLIDLQAVSGLILQQALCSGEIILNRSPVLYASLLKKMLYNQADMMPHTKMILKKSCQRFISG